MSTTYHEFDHDGKHYRLVYDDGYQVDRSCGGSETCDQRYHKPDRIMADEKLAEELRGKGITEQEECNHYYQQELDKLKSGEWVALGCITTRPCGGASHEGHPDQRDSAAHCPCCSGTEELDSCWGIVVENSQAKAEEFCKQAGW